MAITILQQPTSPNAAFTNLPFVVSGSSNASQPQFQYVLDIYESGSNNLISRLTQPSNPVGAAVFEPSKIIQGKLSPDNNWTDIISVNTSSGKEFIFKFGELYSTSTSGSVTVYPNLISSSLQLNLATVNTQEVGSYNLDTEYTIPQIYENIIFDGSPSSGSPSSDRILSNDPYLLNRKFTNKFVPDETTFSFKPIGINDYQTVSVYNNQPYVTVYSGSTPFTTGTTLAHASVRLIKKNSNSLIFYGEIYDKSSQTVDTPAVSGSLDGFIATVGVGPQNLYVLPMASSFTSSLGTGSFGEVMAENPDWSNYTVDLTIRPDPSTPAPRIGQNDFVYFYNETLDIYDFAFGSLIQQPSVLKMKSATNYPYKNCDTKTRFAWLNRYGVWDYYSIYNPIRRLTNVERDNVNLPNVNYSGNTSIYTSTNRDITNYHTAFNDNYTIDTQLIDQVVATWLEELLESPSVFIQQGDNFIPIVITNSSYTANTNTSRQKQFIYTIEFVPSKGRNLLFELEEY